MLLPWIVPEIVTALAWKSIYDPLFGGLNPILLGARHHRPAARLAVRPATWRWPASSRSTSGRASRSSPCCCSPASRRSTASSYEAAEVDGANAVQRFRHVTLPGLRYVIIVSLLLSFISTFNQFGLIFLMTGGGPSGATQLYSILAYEKAIGSLQYGPGSAIALQRRAADGAAHLAAGQVHAPRRRARRRADAGPGHRRPPAGSAARVFEPGARRRLLAVRAGCSAASRRSAGLVRKRIDRPRRRSRCFKPTGASAVRHRPCGCWCCCRSWSSCCSRSTG